jgi:hypothetical protein
MFNVRTRTGAVLACTALALVGAGTALAAHPEKSRKFAGTTSGPKLNGFTPAVTFKTSSNGTRILKFDFQSTGCFGSGGRLTPGVNYLAKPWNQQVLGTIKVGSNGKFSVENAESTYTVQNQKTVTSASVSGKFTNSKTASGTVTYSQTFSQPGSAGSSCGPVKLTFKAKAK